MKSGIGRFIFAGVSLVIGVGTTCTAHALINAKPIEGYPDLVRLVFRDGTMCTGTFINETSILTAAHCLVKHDRETIHKVDQILSSNDQILKVEHLNTILHPKFDHGSWPSFDVGIVKTTKNSDFKGNFQISHNPLPWSGRAKLYGCGISEFVPKMRSRAAGEDGFLRIGSVLFFLGKSKNDPASLGSESSIAPNDSGAPIVDAESGKIIAIATQGTAKDSAEYHLPALSIGTSLAAPEIQQFLDKVTSSLSNSPFHVL